MFKQFQHIDVVNMTNETHEKEMLERLEKIEETLARLSDGIDNLTRGMKNHFRTPRKDGSVRHGPSGDYGLHGSFDAELHEKPPSPWALKSIKSSEQDRKINIDPKILAGPETLVPTLRALKSNPEGLTAREVGKITRRSRSTEANYLSKMFMLGFVDKIKFGKNAKYKYSDRWLPPHIKDQI